MKLRRARPGDAAAIAHIYAPYVTGSTVSFETEPPDEAAIALRMEAGGDIYPWLIADDGVSVAGYAYATAFRARPAYRFTVETSIYLAPERQRQGIAGQLYGLLLWILTRQGYTQAIAAVTLPNEPSVRFHERHGFERSGIYRRVGYKLGNWHDVGLWQRDLAPAENPPAEPLKLSELPDDYPR